MSSAPDTAAAPVWPRVIKLKHPVTLDADDDPITTLTFQRGKAGNLKGIKLSDELAANDLMLIASRLCGQPLRVIENLDIDDVGAAIEVALDFLGKFLATAGMKLSR